MPHGPDLPIMRRQFDSAAFCSAQAVIAAAFSFYLTPTLCVSQELWPLTGLEVLRSGITKPRAIRLGNGSQRGVTDATASR